MFCWRSNEMYLVSLALLRIERVQEAVKNLDRSLEERLHSQELIGSVTDVESEDKIHIKSRSVTFSWQRGIKIGKSWLLMPSVFIIIRYLLYHSNVSGPPRCSATESVVFILYTLHRVCMVSCWKATQFLYRHLMDILVQRCSLQACKGNLKISGWNILLLYLLCITGSKINLCWNLCCKGTHYLFFKYCTSDTEIT
jgi:hypothetical protein